MAQQAPSKFQGVSTFGPLPPTKRGYGLHVNYGALNEKIDGKSVLKDKICYGAGVLAIVRDVENINQLTTFNGHQGKVTCVSPAPNGNWVASGDDTGVVHVWSYPFLTLKNTVRVGNTINELRWTTDSAMILAAGNGSNEFAKAFRFDAQNPLGKIDRIVKQALSADWSPIKPHRVVVTTEDNEVLFYHGVPFKYDSCTRLHTRYPNCVRFSPDGKYFASVGSDSQIILYNGLTGEKVNELKDDNGHKGSILSVAWKADSTELATASADKTVKVWNVAEGKVVHTWTSKLYNSVEDQQASIMWPAKSDPISVGISGAISFWSRSQEDPVQVVQGHHSSIISRAFNRANGTLYSGDLEGRLIATDVNTGSVISYSGAGHGQTPLCAVTIGPDNTIYTAGYDQTVQKHNADYKFGDIVAKVPANVKSMVATKDALVVAMASDIYTYNPSALGEPIQKEKFSADRLVLSQCGAKVYAVSSSTKVFRVYALGANGLTLEKTVDAEFTSPQDVAVGPTGQVFSCEATQVIPWKPDFSGAVSFGWEYHTGQITSLAVSPSNKYAASVGNDRILTVWMDMETLKGNKNQVFRAQETFVFVDFVDDNNLVLVTQDNLVKKMHLNF